MIITSESNCIALYFFGDAFILLYRTAIKWIINNYHILQHKKDVLSGHHKHTTDYLHEKKSNVNVCTATLETFALLVGNFELRHHRRHWSRLCLRLIKSHNYWVNIQLCLWVYHVSCQCCWVAASLSYHMHCDSYYNWDCVLAFDKRTETILCPLAVGTLFPCSHNEEGIYWLHCSVSQLQKTDNTSLTVW